LAKNKTPINGKNMKNNQKHLFFFLLILFFLYFSTLKWLVESWLFNPYYSHGFLVPIISVYVIWRKKENIARIIEKTSSDYGFYIIVIALILYMISFFWTIRFLSGISLIMSLGGLIIFLYGKEIMKEIIFPIGFLIFMVPIPFVDILTPPIQKNSAIYSTKLANIIGIPAFNIGYEIHLPEASFEVAMACSGLRSILSLLVIAVLFAYLLDGSLLLKGTVLLSSIPLAISGNILRITSVLFIASKYGTEAAMEFFHNFSSLILFGVSLLGLFLIGRCFGRLQFKKTL
jgi:exosortase